MTNTLANKTYVLLKRKFDEFWEDELARSGNDLGSLHTINLEIDEIWWDFMGKLGCVPYDDLKFAANPFRHPDGFVIVLNPQSIWKRSIAVPEEVAIKAVALGEFP